MAEQIDSAATVRISSDTYMEDEITCDPTNPFWKSTIYFQTEHIIFRRKHVTLNGHMSLPNRNIWFPNRNFSIPNRNMSLSMATFHFQTKAYPFRKETYHFPMKINQLQTKHALYTETYDFKRQHVISERETIFFYSKHFMLERQRGISNGTMWISKKNHFG